jgi:hypothetical protein
LQRHLVDHAAGGLMPQKDDRTRLLRVARLASVSLTVLAVVALGVFAATGDSTVTRHTTVVRQAASTPPAKSKSASGAPVTQLAPSEESPDAQPALVSVPTLLGSEPPLTPSPAASSVVTTPAAPTPAPVAPSAPAGSTGTTPTEPDPGGLPACPLPLNAPADPGGLQSLVSFAPYLGPFSSEAFAVAPAVQPVLQAVGPFLVALAAGYASAPASVASSAAQIESLENEGYSVLSPLYGPNRSQLLAAESQLATALAPLATDAADTQTTSCLVDIEAALAPAPTAG